MSTLYPSLIPLKHFHLTPFVLHLHWRRWGSSALLAEALHIFHHPQSGISLGGDGERWCGLSGQKRRYEHKTEPSSGSTPGADMGMSAVGGKIEDNTMGPVGNMDVHFANHPSFRPDIYLGKPRSHSEESIHPARGWPAGFMGGLGSGRQTQYYGGARRAEDSILGSGIKEDGDWDQCPGMQIEYSAETTQG
jgi:hypothetical protein